jgi:hypothetical protein
MAVSYSSLLVHPRKSKINIFSSTILLLVSGPLNNGWLCRLQRGPKKVNMILDY